MHPATSFHSVTSFASSARASTVAVRSVPPRPRVTTSPSQPAPMKPGTTTRSPRSSGVAGATVGVEERLRVGDGARDAGALQRGGEDCGGEPLTAREDLVARARRQLA